MSSPVRQRFAVAGVPAALTAAALAAPYLALAHYTLAALAITLFFSPVCHQDPARSLWLFGAPVAVCARCLGMYLGAALGAWVRAPQRVLLPVMIGAASINLLDITTELIGLHGNWIATRFGFGFALGVSLGALVGNWAARYSER